MRSAGILSRLVGLLGLCVGFDAQYHYLEPQHVHPKKGWTVHSSRLRYPVSVSTP